MSVASSRRSIHAPPPGATSVVPLPSPAARTPVLAHHL
jgi:hypothetical protein